MRELRQYIERNRLLWQSLRDKIDPSWRTVPEEVRRAIKMPNEAWIESHQSCTGEVRGDWIIGENDFAEMPMSSV